MAGDPLWQRYGVTEESAARRLRDGFAAGATIAVAEIDGVPAGFIWYVERGAFNRSGYIMLIGVQGDARGTGVGRALMAHAEATLFAHVCRCLSAGVRLSTRPPRRSTGGWATNGLARSPAMSCPASAS